MRTGNRGQVLVLVALAFAVFLGFAALAVDVAYMYTVRNELQRCSDAGALAGASAFNEPAFPWSPIPTDVGPQEAARRARDYASRDIVVTSPLDPAVGEVVVTFPPLDNQVQVTTLRNVGFFFAPIFGMRNKTISASAVARAYYRAGPPPDNSVQLVE